MPLYSGSAPRCVLVFLLALLLEPQWAGAVELDALPGARVAAATSGDITRAWLVQPTQRYEHFVLGGRYEAAGVRVELSGGEKRELMLPADAVFEDRDPRVIDMDRDGRNELLLVHSTRDAGSSLVFVGVRGSGSLQILAATPPTGQANRWLNPAGVARFLGTDDLQVAIVRKPHLEGRLEFWSYDNTRLTLRRSISGVSNHRIGSVHQRLSAVLPRSHGGDLLLIPRLGRRSVLLIDAAQTEPILAEYRLPGPADGEFKVRCHKGRVLVTVPLEGGGSATVAPGTRHVNC